MIFTRSLYDKIITHRSLSYIVYGNNDDLFRKIIHLSEYIIIRCKDSNYYYHSYDNSYYLDGMKHKRNIINIIKELCVSPTYYTDHSKKIIIVSRYDTLQAGLQQSIKRIMDDSYMTCIFILHLSNVTGIDANIRSRCILYSLPPITDPSTTTEIAYSKVISLLKKDIDIHSIRELVYMYYMDHTNSTELQRLLIKRIGSNLYLPNSIKTKVIEDICKINIIYQHSYRKPIYLEYMIISLHKNLQNYTFNI